MSSPVFFHMRLSRIPTRNFCGLAHLFRADESAIGGWPCLPASPAQIFLGETKNSSLKYPCLTKQPLPSVQRLARFCEPDSQKRAAGFPHPAENFPSEKLRRHVFSCSAVGNFPSPFDWLRFAFCVSFFMFFSDKRKEICVRLIGGTDKKAKQFYEARGLLFVEIDDGFFFAVVPVGAPVFQNFISHLTNPQSVL